MIPIMTAQEAISSILTNSLSLLIAIFFVVLLIIKEIAGSIESKRARRLSQTINIQLIPIVIVFIIIISARVAEVFR
jgi:hypothetical protein